VHGRPETAVVWSRAALENQVKAALAARGITFPFESMRDRIRTAVVHGMLDPALERAANSVWIRGNTTVHNDPDAVRDALGTVRIVMRALEDVQRRWPG
jgi:hypothetical protein